MIRALHVPLLIAAAWLGAAQQVHALSPALRQVVLPGYSDEARALFGQSTVQPRPARKRAADATIRALKSCGMWTVMDVFYVLGAGDSQRAGLNWKNPGTLTLGISGTPTFTVDRGYTGNGSDAILSTGYNAASASLGLTQNDAHVAAYVLTNTTTAVDDVQGDNGTAARAGVRGRNGTAGSYRVSVGTQTTFATGGNVPHLVMGVRRDSSNQIGFRNGVQDTTAAVGSNAVPTNFTILGNSVTTAYSDRQVAAVSIGRAPTDAQALCAFDVMQNLMRSLGAVP